MWLGNHPPIQLGTRLVVDMAFGTLLVTVLLFGLCCYFLAQCAGVPMRKIRSRLPDLLQLYLAFVAAVLLFAVAMSLLQRNLPDLMGFVRYTLSLLQMVVRGAGCMVFLCLAYPLTWGARGFSKICLGARNFWMRNQMRLIGAMVASLVAAACVSILSRFGWNLLYWVFGSGTPFPLAYLRVSANFETQLVCAMAGFAWVALADRQAQSSFDWGAVGELVRLHLFSFVTCGIYWYYWCYKVGTRLTRESGRRPAMSPVESVVLLVLFDDWYQPIWYAIHDSQIVALSEQRGDRFAAVRLEYFFWTLILSIVGILLPLLLNLSGIYVPMLVCGHILLVLPCWMVACHLFIKRARMVVDRPLQ